MTPNTVTIRRDQLDPHPVLNSSYVDASALGLEQESFPLWVVVGGETHGWAEFHRTHLGELLYVAYTAGDGASDKHRIEIFNR